MVRSEATPERLIAVCMEQFGKAREWDGVLRLKWILNGATTVQMDEDDLVLLTAREKNKTL